MLSGRHGDEEEEGDEEGGLEEAEGECHVELAEEVGGGGDVEEEVGEGPQGDEEDEERSDGPERVEALEVVGPGRPGFHAEVEDEPKREEGQRQDRGDQGQNDAVRSRNLPDHRKYIFVEGLSFIV